MIKILSLDLQGTLSNSNFSNYFWLEFLPKKYAEKNEISLTKAKEVLKEKFQEYGKYDLRYYDDKYWSNLLGFDTQKELENFEIQPSINKELYDFISKTKIPKIIVSTTTNIFINYELKDKINDFEKIYSCVDYFKSGGKTKKVFQSICKELNIKPNELLHIGDSKTMDYSNAIESGINAILYENSLPKLKNEIIKYLEE